MSLMSINPITYLHPHLPSGPAVLGWEEHIWASRLRPSGVSADETDLLRCQPWISLAPVTLVRGWELFNEVQS